jgi:hypothetical protein
MVLFDKLSFSQVVGIFQAFKLYCERSMFEHPVVMNATEESEKSESDMEFSLCSNEKVPVSEDAAGQMRGKEFLR